MQSRSGQGQLVGGPAVFRIVIFVFGFDINKVFASLSQGVEHPHYVVAVFFNGVGEVKTATAPWGPDTINKLGKPLLCRPRKVFCAFFLPLVT